jgi:TonB family protein
VRLALSAVVVVVGLAPARAQKLTPPELIERVEAEYPPEAARAGKGGAVVLELTVDESGRVVEARVVAAAGSGFDEAALEAARRFRFRPGLADGKPVPVRVTYRYSFAMQHRPASDAKNTDSREKSTSSNGKNTDSDDQPPPVRLRGEVRERGTRLPLGAVAVIVAGADGVQLARADTDGTGRFELRLPAGARELTVVCAAPDHVPLRVPERLGASDVLEVRYVLARTSYALYEATVRAPAREEIARVSLAGDEVRRIPGTKGDALAAAFNLPSVARSPFDTGQLILRGSAPGESSAFLLGMQIPQAFHFGVLVSTFNAFLLERFDLIPSNFSVRYGRLTGGVVEIVPRDPKRDRFHGDINIDIYAAHLIVEGPIGKGAFALSFRRSYADAVLKEVLPVDSLTVAPRYYDYQAMLDYPVGGGKLKLMVFGTDDEFAFVQKTPPDVDPSLAGSFSTRQWNHTLFASYKRATERTEWEATIAVGPQHFDGALGGAARFSLDVVETDLRAEARFRLTRSMKLTIGLDVQSDYYWVSVDAPRPMTEEKVQGPLATEDQLHLHDQGFEINPAIYAQLEWRPVERLQLIPGVRVDWFRGNERTYAQPRLMARVRVAYTTWLKAGVGLFYQPPLPPYGNAVLGNPNIRPEQAVHVTVGVETAPFRQLPQLGLEVNLFYKDLRYLAVTSTDFTQRDGKIVPLAYSDDGIGRVYGADLLLKLTNSKRLYGWIAYTLLRSERRDHEGEPWRPFQYDQTHILAIVAGVHLPWDVDVGARFRYVTGSPDTQLTGGIYDADRDATIPIPPSQPFTTRLPDFLQLDFRVDKRFIFRSWIFAVYIDVANLTNYKNVEGYAYSYDYTRRAPVTGLPVIPSLGLRASF